jgi:hypothetical protein
VTGYELEETVLLTMGFRKSSIWWNLVNLAKGIFKCDPTYKPICTQVYAVVSGMMNTASVSSASPEGAVRMTILGFATENGSQGCVSGSIRVSGWAGLHVRLT